MTISTLTKKAVSAMESAVRKVVQDHQKRKRPLALWKNGKVVLVPPRTDPVVREKPASYGKRK